MAREYRRRKKALYKNATEAANPEGTALTLEGLGDPLAKFQEIAEAAGLPRRTVNILSKRLERRWVPVSDRIKRVRTKELQGLIEDRMLKALEYMDDVTFASADLKDLSIAFGVLYDKRQLLMGQPTQIMTVTERQSLNDLLPEIVKEAQRRGITIDASPASADGEEGVSTYVHDNHSDNIPRNEVAAAVKRGRQKLGVGSNKKAEAIGAISKDSMP